MNWYLKVIKEHYADFKGRARRQEYWMFVLINMIISWSITLLGLLFDSSISSGISGLYSLAVLIPGLAVAVRRLHDIGKSGWFLLLSFIPILGWIYLIILLATDSEAGSNKWGSNPKGFGNDTAIDSIGEA